MLKSEDRLVKDSCRPESFKVGIESANNLITTLRPYIQGHDSFSEASLFAPKVLPTRRATHSRSPRKKMTKMFKLESSSSKDDEDDQTTPGAELSSNILSRSKTR